jgi:hypothetical protein
MSIIEKLTEGVINRDLSRESSALISKWESTGLLEGIEGDHNRNSMACLLENQAKELLREASTMAGGDVEGFAAVAFPIVRRVFGGLVANELVSVQPMSLPSGLIFFLDFTLANDKLGNRVCDSIYGGNVIGSEITGGVKLESTAADGDIADRGFYNLNNGYASSTGSVQFDQSAIAVVASGTVGGTGDFTGTRITTYGQNEGDVLTRFDADLSGTAVAVATLPIATLVNGQFNEEDYVSLAMNGITGSAGTNYAMPGLVRRLTRPDPRNDELSTRNFIIVVTGSSAANAYNNIKTAGNAAGEGGGAGNSAGLSASFAITDNLTAGGAVGSVIGAPTWGLEGLGSNDGNTASSCGTSNTTQAIAEIDIKVDSVAITAQTKKLRAKWTPELQQDINAYHNLDAEVELTSILSETIALEIDQEILADLIVGATAGTYYWSRKPGKFVSKTGGESTNQTLFPDFTGTVSEWYETLLETVNDVSAQIHRKTLRGGANFIVTSPEVANVLEFTNGFRASTTADENRGQAGAVKTGSISKKFDVYVDPYFPRNVVLVGRKGGSFLESGYVYSPYVPLQTTPTIFDPENFTPRKGVMTRYGKKMVRPDMYGLVIVEDLLG